MSWKILALLSAFFAALTAIFAKIGIKHVPSNLATLIRTLVVIAFASAVVSVRGEWSNPLKWESRTLVFLVLSGLATAASWLCYYRALQTGPVSMVTALDKLSIALTVLLSALLFREHLSPYGWLGAAMITAGAVLIAFK